MISYVSFEYFINFIRDLFKRQPVGAPFFCFSTIQWNYGSNKQDANGDNITALFQLLNDKVQKTGSVIKPVETPVQGSMIEM